MCTLGHWQNASSKELSEEGFFSGRLSRINQEIRTARVKVDFDNIKYINAKDKLEFWDENQTSI